MNARSKQCCTKPLKAAETGRVAPTQHITSIPSRSNQLIQRGTLLIAPSDHLSTATDYLLLYQAARASKSSGQLVNKHNLPLHRPPRKQIQSELDSEESLTRTRHTTERRID